MSGLEDIDIDQTQRMISVESFHLGAKKIILTAFEGNEQLSVLPRFRFEFLSHGRALKPSEILGQSLKLALRGREKTRFFNGIISQFRTTQSSMRDHYHHVAELVPPAWLLTLNRRCRIFHEKKATEAISQVLQEGSITTRMKPAGGSREYIVQYCESDFNFVERLLEEEGLFYYFALEEQNCPMVVCNGSADYLRGALGALVLYDSVELWNPQYRIGPSSFKHAVWDFKAVDNVEGDVKSLAKVQVSGVPDRDVYEYPGRYTTAGEARTLARVRIEEQEVEYIEIHGNSREINFQASAIFKIKDHTVALPAGSQETDSYVLTGVEHRARDMGGVHFDDTTTSYENSFTCIPSELNFRPRRAAPRPMIHGPQTATVTETPDEYGRAKVKFHWEGTEVSRWTRVAQSWAYNKMGTQFFPRVDSEVVVEFLDGDPDHPIIVGMVYNGKNKPPFDVPANKTQSGVRGANWGDAGIADTSNEFRFEDKAGSEEIYTHAQKDMRRVVVHDDKLIVETGDRTINVQQGDISVKVDMGQETREAMKSITLKVGSSSIVIDQTSITLKSTMITIEGTATVDVKSPMTTVKGDGMLTLKGGVIMIN